jgi:NADPH:quinone reductase-like Zn-dependent oxidoreductase
VRAWTLPETRGPEAYALERLDDPTPGPGEVRVSLRASSLNHLDLWVAHGLPAPPAFPHVPGADGAGVVDTVGGGVEGIAAGDEVVLDPSTSCGGCDECRRGRIPFCPDFRILGEHRWGTHAELVVVPAVNAVAKPAALSWEDAAAFGLVVSSAVRMVRRGRVAAADRVLVVGGGAATATAAFLVAAARGAELYATSTQPEGRAWAEAHGAVAVFDSGGPYDEASRAATGGHGMDVVLDNVGTVTFERSIKALARGGRLVTNGSTSGRTAELHLPTLFWRQLEVIGATMNDHEEFAEAVRLVTEGAVETPVAATFAFEDYPAALERLEAGDTLGKLVLMR